jgi:DNA-binding SARP family transcriptional activator
VLDPERTFPSDHFVVATGGAVTLRLEHVQVDVEQFLALAESGAAAAAERLYSGDYLEEDLYEDWAPPLRDEVRNVYVTLVRSLARDAAERGDADAAVHYLQRVLGRDPYDEDAHLTLVTTLLAAGRHGEARRRYLAYSARMGDIGVEPAPFPAP